MKDGSLNVELLGRGFAWLDTGTQSLLEAGQLYILLKTSIFKKVACLEEIGFQQGWISKSELKASAEALKKTDYGQYLFKLLEEAK